MVIGLNILAFILELPVLAAVVAIFMLGGSLMGKPGFTFLYRWVLKPVGLVKPDVIEDHPQPHRFAQTVGGSMMGIGVLMLYLGPVGLGWTFVWLVTALAALNLFGGFCIGCAMYYWFNRLQVPGFNKTPPAGVSIPGTRPKSETI